MRNAIASTALSSGQRTSTVLMTGNGPFVSPILMPGQSAIAFNKVIAAKTGEIPFTAQRSKARMDVQTLRAISYCCTDEFSVWVTPRARPRDQRPDARRQPCINVFGTQAGLNWLTMKQPPTSPPFCPLRSIDSRRSLGKPSIKMSACVSLQPR